MGATRIASVGIDVGSTTAKVVALAASGDLIACRIERHRGHARTVVSELLADIAAREVNAPRGVTGSIGVSLTDSLGASPLHEVEAAVEVTRRRHPLVRTIVELGGQDAKLVQLAEDICDDDMQMNDRCAAGTGATLDRVIRRLGLNAEWLETLTLQGELDVASKCGVFAETDVVNLLERGAPPEHAFSALCRAIVQQNLAVLARGRVPRGPVLLLGGPHAHLPVLAEAWREALLELWDKQGLPRGEVSVPDEAELYPAIGAALHAARGERRALTTRGVLTRRDTLPALLEHAVDHELRARLSRVLEAGAKVTGLDGSVIAAAGDALHLGLDAGSTTVKAVLLDDCGGVVASAYGLSTGDPIADARARLDELTASAGGVLSIASAGVTGYGAGFLQALMGADAAPVETLAHLLSALSLDPEVEVVVDVGGTDVKILEIADGAVRDFQLSNQCSAGLGSFLAACAEDMGVPMQRFAQRALSATRAAPFGIGCAVFMDTDRVTFRRDGLTGDELLAGLAWSIPRNIWQFIMPTPLSQLGQRFLLSGGAHRNLAVAVAQARYLEERGKQVQLHPQPGLAGAIGAAIAGQRACRERGRTTRFRGIASFTEGVVHSHSGPDTRCTRCELGCQRTFLKVEGELRTLVVGHTCERGAATEPGPDSCGVHAPDLVGLEARLLFRPLLPPPAETPARRDAPVFGLPRVMAHYRSAPLLMHYLRALGVPEEKIQLSPVTSPGLIQASSLLGANDPCFPAKLVLAHVDALLQRPDVDHVFFPSVTHAAITVLGATDTASCPVVAASPYSTRAALRGSTRGARDERRLLTPELHFLDRDDLSAALFDTFGPLLDLSHQENARALEHGLAAQRIFHAELRRQGSRLLERAKREGRIVAVMLMRPYHADPGVNHGVPRALAARGIAVMGIPALPLDGTLTLQGEEALSTNSGCAEKLWAAARIAAHPNLVAVELGSFRCGQDASILGALSDRLGAAQKPALRLHDLDEDRPATSLDVRLDTFADALKRYEARTLRPSAAHAKQGMEASA